MATGDITVFDEALPYIRDKVFDFDTDTWKLAIIDSVLTPTATDATPMWHASSGTDYDTNQVVSTGNYTSGGETLASVACNEVAGVMTFTATDVTISQHASGFTDGYWGIIYSETAATNQAIAYVEMGGAVSEVAGDVVFEWSSSGIITFSVNV